VAPMRTMIPPTSSPDVANAATRRIGPKMPVADPQLMCGPRATGYRIRMIKPKRSRSRSVGSKTGGTFRTTRQGGRDLVEWFLSSRDRQQPHSNPHDFGTLSLFRLERGNAPILSKY